MRLTNRQHRRLATYLIVPIVLMSDIGLAQVTTPGIGDNDERLPYHLDSLMALGLVGFAVAVALMLNHRSPRIRVFGIALAGVGCFAVAGGIWTLDVNGQFAELRPPRFAIDPFKPVVMRLLAGAFLLTGLLLSALAIRQSRRTDELIIENRNEPTRFGRVSRLYHWTIAILILLLVPMGVFTTMIPYDVEYRQIYYVIHKSIGVTVFLLAGARLAWLMFTPAPGLSSHLSLWERIAARSAHWAFYLLMFAFPISGFVLGTSLGKLSHFYFWDFPLFWGPDEPSLSMARLMHKIFLPLTLMLVLLAHVLGSVKHRYVDRQEDSFRRMIT